MGTVQASCRRGLAGRLACGASPAAADERDVGERDEQGAGEEARVALDDAGAGVGGQAEAHDRGQRRDVGEQVEDREEPLDVPAGVQRRKVVGRGDETAGARGGEARWAGRVARAAFGQVKCARCGPCARVTCSIARASPLPSETSRNMTGRSEVRRLRPRLRLPAVRPPSPRRAGRAKAATGQRCPLSCDIGKIGQDSATPCHPGWVGLGYGTTAVALKQSAAR